MSKILIYGDSNTWGDNFLTGKRIPDEKQWPNILSQKLGSDYKVLQEGLPGRIAGLEEVEKKYKNGKETFMAIFKTNAPVDYLIIALGTNDLQIKYNKSSKKIIEDLLWYTKTIQDLYSFEEDRIKYFNNQKMPKIKYILPVNFDYKDKASVVLDENSELKRQEIISFFKENKIDCIDFSKLELFDDGIHLNYIGHQKVADQVYEVIKNEQ